MEKHELDRLADDGCPHHHDYHEPLGEGGGPLSDRPAHKGYPDPEPWDGSDCQGPSPAGLANDPEIRRLVEESRRFWNTVDADDSGDDPELDLVYPPESPDNPLFTDDEIDNLFDDCRWDDDPNMYDGTYSEE